MDWSGIPEPRSAEALLSPHFDFRLRTRQRPARQRQPFAQSIGCDYRTRLRVHCLTRFPGIERTVAKPPVRTHRAPDSPPRSPPREGCLYPGDSVYSRHARAGVSIRSLVDQLGVGVAERPSCSFGARASWRPRATIRRPPGQPRDARHGRADERRPDEAAASARARADPRRRGHAPPRLVLALEQRSSPSTRP